MPNKMKRYFYILLLMLSFCLASQKSYAQIDPVLTGMIIRFTNTSTKQYSKQMAAMSAQTEGHVWLQSEVESVNNCLKEFDDYLNDFRNIIAYAAQAYGFYYEIHTLCDNMGDLTRQIGDTPVNAIAVALHNKRNDIYVDLGNTCVGVVKIIKDCITQKMNEEDRLKLVLSIRPKLKQVNNKLFLLIKLIKYTNMGLVWNEIVQGTKPHNRDKVQIAKDCLKSWNLNAKSVKSKK